MALVAVSLCNAILPSSLQAIPFEHVIWKTIEIDERWTLTSLNLVYHKDALGARRSRRLHRVPAAPFMRRIECGPAVRLSTGVISSDMYRLIFFS